MLLESQLQSSYVYKQCEQLNRNLSTSVVNGIFPLKCDKESERRPQSYENRLEWLFLNNVINTEHIFLYIKAVKANNVHYYASASE